MSEDGDVSPIICHISAGLRPIGRKASELDHSIIHIYRNSDTFKSLSKLTLLDTIFNLTQIHFSGPWCSERCSSHSCLWGLICLKQYNTNRKTAVTGTERKRTAMSSISIAMVSQQIVS